MNLNTNLNILDTNLVGRGCNAAKILHHPVAGKACFLFLQSPKGGLLN